MDQNTSVWLELRDPVPDGVSYDGGRDTLLFDDHVGRSDLELGSRRLTSDIGRYKRIKHTITQKKFENEASCGGEHDHGSLVEAVQDSARVV